MSLGRICACKRLVMPGESHSCAQLRAQDERRHSRQRRHGRTTARWQQLRELALERDDHRCMLRVDAGCTSVATSVHLRPELEGNHDIATLDDVVSACAHCHGVVDGRRSRSRRAAPARGAGQYDGSSPRPVPRTARVLATAAITKAGNT